MTEQERKLWYSFLKDLPYHFSRQKITGHYIADFYCASKKIIIEIDGSQHFSDEGVEKDIERDKFFESKGFKVLRYTNLDINLRFKEVCLDIMCFLEDKK